MIIIHGGHEHYQLPSLRMKQIYRFFIEAGADAVINHHQHCYSGYEIYQGKPIFYGIGNFCFDNPLYRNNKWNYGYMILLELSTGIDFHLIPYIQCSDEAAVKILQSNVFQKELMKINEVIADDNRLRQENENYYKSCSKSIGRVFEIYSCSRILNKLHAMGILPSIMPKKQIIKLQNFICCESHRDKVEYFFKHKYK